MGRSSQGFAGVRPRLGRTHERWFISPACCSRSCGASHQRGPAVTSWGHYELLSSRLCCSRRTLKMLAQARNRRTVLKLLPAVAVGAASPSPSKAYFAPPPTVEAKVFTRLPDKFRKMRRNSWTELNRGG